MSRDIVINNVMVETKIRVKALPDRCPRCNTFIIPDILYTARQDDSDDTKVFVHVFYGCPKCANVFCVTYRPYREVGILVFTANEVDTLPPFTSKTVIDERISKISPRAVTLFHEAEVAKNNNLIDLAGMGFRKSLECVVKDSLVFFETKTPEEVAKLDLHDAIEQYKENPRIIKAAHTARIIGNEYAHYQAKYEGYDIDLLIKLLHLAFNGLVDEFETREIEELKKASK